MREINKIVIHCSDSDFGNVDIIKDWHVNGNGWSDIGYHYVITNSHPVSTAHTKKDSDGVKNIGRPIEIAGAHVRGHNSDSIGICVIGTDWDSFTNKQLDTLLKLINQLMTAYDISIDHVYGHYELDSKKECPCMDMDFIRAGIENAKDVH